MGEILVVLLVVGFMCGLINGAIAGKKNFDTTTHMFVGFLAGPLGVAATLLMEPKPPQPPGTRSVVCTRCNTRQNVLQAASRFECWHCNLITQ
ncbi:hypothetical protein [Hoyosella altamirensis]|uniref:Uncharacterized protein n=1 Tax=Hoyosella altamirensis TaxID=616997 RepID=A0A839RPJ4_9ACTN|nr:hypothetical protein [Hoyosella altamirensis]MBB3037913.1 hypothetical protein [Hoyosella altamirensis]